MDSVHLEKRAFRYFIACTVIVVSVLQGTLFVLDRPWSIQNRVAIAIAIANLLLAFGILKSQGRRFLAVISALCFAQFSFFVLRMLDGPLPIVPRLLQISIILCYGAIVLFFLLAGCRVLPVFSAALLSFSLAFGIFICEAIMKLISPECCVVYDGLFDRHPLLGLFLHPHSTMKTEYPLNPRGYFEEESVGERKWWLRTAGGGTASLIFPHNDPEVVRIDIKTAASTVPFDIQLNLPHLTVKSRNAYGVRFTARADRNTRVFVGFAESHDPWQGLGLYESIDLTPEWQKFAKNFEASRGEENGRIHFDVGGSAISVELSSVELFSLTEGKEIQPELPPPRHYVSYRSNAFGCRGGDYAIPKPAGITRILILGDSYAQGIGVREEDTFANRLQSLLNKQAEAETGKTYEVINCGLFGYATREERIFYQLFGTKYQPDIVLIAAVLNDDISYWDEHEKYGTPSGKWEQLFLLWKVLQEYLHRRPIPDFAKCTQEILQLKRQAQKQKACLAVVIFRNNSDFAGSTSEGKIWNKLTATIKDGLQGTDIPVLNLGQALYAGHTDEELIVYPELDEHPNEIAHRIAAREILRLLENEHWIEH